MNVTPTDEQAHLIDLFASGGNVAVEALAGTGKTTALELMARSTQRPGRYLTFSKALSVEAQERFPLNVQASTVHSVAFRAWGHEFAHRLGQPRRRSWEIARDLGIRHALVVRTGDRTKTLQPGFLASSVMRAIGVFCQSDDDVPSGRNVAYVEGIDDHDDDGNRGWANNDRVRAELEPYLRAAWADLCRPDGQLPYSHACYLKQWALTRPVLPVDFLLVDEVQDLDRLMIGLMIDQITAGLQVIAVGDAHQQIMGWRGAVSAFDLVEWPLVGFLTRSFRFGSAIAAVANRVLEVLDPDGLRVVGAGNPQSSVGEVARPDAVLCRSNAGAVETVLRYQESGLHPHLVGGATDVVAFARAAIDLQERGRTSHPELACFDSWVEVKQYVDQDPGGDDLKLMVRLLDEFGPTIVMDALAGMPAERDADLVVSTAHKAKGRGWGKVRLGSDFPESPESPEEWRLLYVAATRAKDVLDLRSCEALVDLVAGPIGTAL